MTQSTVLVVLPTYNEARNLPTLVPQVLAQAPGPDVLVVDDASPDGTGEVADALAAEHPGVHVLHRPGKQGLGAAYLAGFSWALERDYAVVVEMDADLSHNPTALPGLLAALDSAGLAIGCRYGPGRTAVVNWSLRRLLLSRGANQVVRWATGLPLHDATSGYRAFRRDVLEDVLHDDVLVDGYAFQVELAWRAWHRGHRVVEHPIVFTDRVHGDSKLDRGVILEAIHTVGRLALASRRR